MGQLLASPPVQWACNGQPWIKTHFSVFPAPAVRPLWSLKSVQDFENGNAFGPLGTHTAGGEWKLSRRRRCEGRNEDGFDYVERSFEATQQGLGPFRGSPGTSPSIAHWSETSAIIQIPRLRKQMERMIKIRDDFLRNEQELKEQECKEREQQFFRIWKMKMTSAPSLVLWGTRNPSTQNM